MSRVTSIFPSGAQVGTEIAVQVAGQDLDGLAALEFGHAGIRAVRVEHGVDEFGVPTSDAQNGFKVSVAAEVPAGRYEMRARGDFGVSNAVLFDVGTTPEVVEAGGNATFESAMALTVPVVVNGRADDNAFDYYAIDVAAGTVIEISCVSEGIDSKMDPVVDVLDGGGVLVAGNNDAGAGGRDSRLVFKSDAGGRHVLRVQDLLFEGGGEHRYRMSVGAVVSAVSVYPNVVQRGKDSEVLVSFGDGRTERRTIKPEGSLRGGLGAASRMGAGIDWMEVAGVPVGVSDLPVVEESESNDDWEAATKLTVPCVVAAQSGLDDDRDRFVFEAKAGDVLVLELVGDRLGAHADYAMAVFKVTRGEDGTWGEGRIAENDDAGWDVGIAEVVRKSRDPRLTLTVKEDGLYGVKVWNQFSGARVVKHYGLRVGPAAPAFRVLVSAGAAVKDGAKVDPTPVVLREGGAALIDVWIERRDGFGGDVRVGVEGLREGTECREVVIAAGGNHGKLVLRDRVGGAWSGGVRVFGVAGEVREEAVVHSPRWNVGNPAQERYESRTGGEMTVSVVGGERAPFEIEAEVADAEVVIGGKLEIPIKLKLNGELKGEMKIYPEGIVGMKKRPELKLKKDQLEGKLVIDCSVTNENKLKAGVSSVFLRGEGLVGGYRPALAKVGHWEGEKKRMDGVVAGLEESIKALEAATATAESVNAEKGKRDRAVASRKRVEEFLQRANNRAKAQDKREVVFGRPFVLRLKAPEKKEEEKK